MLDTISGQSGAGMVPMFIGVAPPGPRYFTPGLGVHARRLILLRRSVEALMQYPHRSSYLDKQLCDDDAELRATAVHVIGFMAA